MGHGEGTIALLVELAEHCQASLRSLGQYIPSQRFWTATWVIFPC